MTDAKAGTGAQGLPARPLLVYHDSWYERPATGPAATTLATLPGYMNLVALSFVRPDAAYPGRLDLKETGLQYGFPGTVLRDAIALLKQRQPGTRVLLAVGGANYANWDALNLDALVRLVQDLGVDGVDLDFEPVSPGCSVRGRVRCLSDAMWLDLVARFRAAFPRPLLLTVPGWSIGAYGEGAFRDAQPRGPHTGSILNLLRSPQAAAIDLVSIMAYEGGPTFDPWQAWQAYRQVWKGPLALGVQVPPSQLGGPTYTVPLAEQLARNVAQDPQGGMMLYPLLGRPPGTLGPDNPDGRLLAQALCRGLGLDGCAETLR
ncbi:glycosyl hydrolase family 18 protein [Azospirillum argentinense]|uniref:glycosyl hydrolase family 18 protein n=1 Tax=Azospirillum argentinense TaxID=2970906 RepID=UPI0032DF35E3